MRSGLTVWMARDDSFEGSHGATLGGPFLFFVVALPAACAGDLNSMNSSVIAMTQPRAAACPDLSDEDAVRGLARELPRISPELLYFESVQAGGQWPRVAAKMPDETLAFAHRDVIYAMTADEWMHFEAMRKAA